MSKPIQPLLFGGDINVYSVARAFHTEYGIKTIAYGMYHVFPCAYSRIIDYRVCRNNDEPEQFLKNIQTVAAECPDKTVLVLGCGDNYIQLAARFRDQMPANVIAPYIDADLLDRLIDKEYFYQLCDKYDVPYPKTFIYEKSMGHDFELPFSAPFVAKPAESVTYWQHDFEGSKKVYICDTRQELEDALDAVYNAGFEGHMILQDFIPGDDTNMWVMTNYSNGEGAVKFMCLGHTLLEEHSPHGIGNHAVIITEKKETLSLQIKSLLEALNYTGFSNFDIKYDSRDGQYKVFEINCRQGRSNFYVTGAGHNIAKLLVEDRVDGIDQPFAITANQALWRMVPRFVAFRLIPKAYHPQMRALIRSGADNHPMEYRYDMTPNRIWRIWKNHVGCAVRFFKHNKRPES